MSKRPYKNSYRARGEPLLDELEGATINASVDRSEITVESLLEAAIPAEHLQALKAAHPYAANTGYAWDVVLRRVGTPVAQLSVSCAALPCVCPKDMYLECNGVFDTAVSQVRAILDRFDDIRTVLGWMDDNKVTAGWARHYIPALGNILPPEHDFHQADGQVYREVHMPLGIREKIRGTADMLARAMFAKTVPEPSGKCVGHLRIFRALGAHRMVPWFYR